MMVTATRSRPGGRAGTHEPRADRCAVAWINGRSASLALSDGSGQVLTCEIDRGLEPEALYVSIVARAIGDRDRLVILGPGGMRLALERQYVAFHAPRRCLIDVEPAGAIDQAELRRRLDELDGRDLR